MEDSILYYKGSIKYDTVSMLIKNLQESFTQRGLSITVYKKVLMVMIELLENIYKYCDENCSHIETEEIPAPEINIFCEDEVFYITAGNPVRNVDAMTIRQRLDVINTLDKVELIELYKHTISNGRFSNKGGAGIGLMEIARIASRPMSYTFTNIDSNHEYYTITVCVV